MAWEYLHISPFQATLGRVILYYRFCDVLLLVSGAMGNWRTREVLKGLEMQKAHFQQVLDGVVPTWPAAIWGTTFSFSLAIS